MTSCKQSPARPASLGRWPGGRLFTTLRASVLCSALQTFRALRSMFATLHAGIGVKQTHSYARSLLFKQVTLTEFWQISLFLLVLWPMMPLILRMKNDKTFLVITGSVSIVMVALLTAMKICDQYYVKSVFEAYLQGEDYQRKSDFLSKFASSNAIAYTQFLIDESDFLRQGVLEAKQIKEKSEHGHVEEICKLRNRITEHMSGLDERFITTGYSNRSSVVGFEAIRKKYDHLTNSLNGTSNAGK